MRPLIDGSTTSQENEKNINVTLKQWRHSHLSNVSFRYLNINFIRNKFGDLNKIVNGNIENLCIAETKLEESFPESHFVYQYNHSLYTDITKTKMAWWYLFSQTYLQVGLIILKFHLIFYYTFIIPFNVKRKMVDCISLQRFFPEKQIFFLVFDKSIRILLYLV